MDDQGLVYEDDFQQSGGGWWVRLVGIVAYMLIILAYAWQTLELVGWLFPGENWFMKAVTVFVCDGCATGYAMAEMFYRFRLRRSKHLVFGMWVVTFIFSTCATIVQMYLASVNLIPHKIDPTITMIAYGIIIGAFVVNIIAITSVIRMEYNAAQPQRFYMDDRRSSRRAIQQPQVRIVEQVNQPRVVTPALAASKDQVLDPGHVKPEIDDEKSLEKKKSLGEKIWAARDAIDAKLDGRKDESQELPVVEQSPVDEGEKIQDKPKLIKLPSDPSKWSHKHWMLAHDTLPRNEYNKLFDEYRGDEPEKEYEVIDKPITEDRPGHDPRTRRLGGNQRFEDQEDLDENPS